MFLHLCPVCIQADSLVCVVCLTLICVCFPQSVFRPTTNVYTASPSPPYLLPFSPSLQRFTEQHRGLASWCLHCKSGFDNKAMIRSYSYSKNTWFIYSSFLFCMASRCIDVWPRWQAHFQLLFIAFAGQGVKQQAQTRKIKWDFFPLFLKFLRPRCADVAWLSILREGYRSPFPSTNTQIDRESVKVDLHGYQEVTKLSKTGPCWPFFFMNMHKIFLEKLQGVKCRSRWSRLVKPEKHQCCCFWEIGIMGMRFVFRTSLCQQNYFNCFGFFF